MITKGTWKTPIIAEYCINCGKPFVKYKNSTPRTGKGLRCRNRRGRNMANVRTYNAICCSKKCSLAYNYNRHLAKFKIRAKIHKFFN